MNKFKAASGLLLIDLGIFVGAIAFLPQRGSWGHSGPWSYFVNSRDRWDIAWGVLAASLILSAGIFLMLEALGAFGRSNKATKRDAA